MTTQMTIGKKLTLCCGLIILLVLGLGLSSMNSVGNLSGNLDAAINRTAKKIELAGQINASVSDMRAGQRGLILFSMMKSPEKVEMSKQTFRGASDRIETAITDIRPLLSNDAGRRAVDIIDQEIKAWLPLYQEIGAACASGKFDGPMVEATDRTVVMASQMQTAAQKLLTIQRELLNESARDAVVVSSHSRWTAIVLIGVCLLASGVVLWVVRDISSTLCRIAGELGQGADQVANAASQVSSSSQSLAQGASEQAASLEETSASSQEIHAMAQRNTENSHFVAELVTGSGQKFEQTNRSLELTVAAMSEINTQSGRISKIIKVIDEIAFQTNILALNAAVEAARAGEAGMGFAVVADEVRNLAQRCAQAAKDTSALIEESISKSKDGKVKVDQVASAISAITEDSGKIKTLVDEVNLGSQEQTRGIDQIGKAITQMERVTQTTAASAEESAAAAEELTAQSESLKEIVIRLNALVGDTQAHSEATFSRKLAEAIPAPLATLSARRAGSRQRVSSKPSGKNSGDVSHALVAVAAKSGQNAIPLDGDFSAF